MPGTPEGAEKARAKKAEKAEAAKTGQEASSSGDCPAISRNAGEANPVKTAEDRVRLERARLELERLERERDAQAHRDFEDFQAAITAKRERLRREVIQQAKDLAIGPWPGPGGSIPAATRTQALEAIEAKFAALPVSEMPFLELVKIAEKARDEVLATQAHARAEAEARRRHEEQERLEAARREREEDWRRREEAERQAAAERERQARADEARERQREAEAAERKHALVQHGLDVVREDLEAHPELDEEEREEILSRAERGLARRVEGGETKADVEEFADEVLTDEFGDDEPDEDDQEDDDEEENDSDEEDE